MASVNNHPTLTHEAVVEALGNPDTPPNQLLEMGIQAANVQANSLARQLIQAFADRAYADYFA